MTDEQAPHELIKQERVFQLQVRDNQEQPWIDFGTPLANRDAMTRIQAFRIQAYPDERQQVLCHLVQTRVQTRVDEIIGDGPGETSVSDLLARNEQVAALVDAPEQETQQPSL